MKTTIIKYSLLLVIVLAIVIPASIFLSGLSGCARVLYKEKTSSIKCNFVLMLIQLKSIKGNESFEVGEFVRECYRDLDVIRCKKRVYGDGNFDQDRDKRLEFLECLKEGK